MLALVLVVSFASLLLFPSSTASAQDDDDGGNGKPFIKPAYNAKPPQEHHESIADSVWKLEPPEEGSKARGTVRLECYSDDKDAFRMDVQGLDPKKVYTVWFVSSLKDGADRAGIGKEPFKFKSTGGGKALYQAPLSTCPLISWKWVEIREHPDGDPTHIEQSVRVLKARMQPQ